LGVKNISHHENLSGKLGNKTGPDMYHLSGWSIVYQDVAYLSDPPGSGQMPLWPVPL